MKKPKDVIKFIKDLKKKYNYHWEKEGKEIIQAINDKNINKPELKKILSILLITEEIPNDMIFNFWLTCSGAKDEIEKNKGQYQKLIKAFNILINKKHPFYLYMQKKMSVDLNRSFNCKNTDENIIQLKNILSAFTVRDVTLNYCQGLNTIVAYILQKTNFKEEESFYLFLKLMENILPYDYYLFGIGVEAELNIINILLEKYEPDLMKHLKKFESNMIIYSILTQFVTSLLIFKIDRNITNILFNCFFGFYLLENNKKDTFFYFYKIILAIFKILKPDLMKYKNMQKIYETFTLDKEHKLEEIQFIIYYTLFDESKNKFDINHAKKIRAEEIEKVIKTKILKFNYKNEDNIECNIIYPLCIEEYNYILPLQLNVTYEKISNNKDKIGDNNINKIIIDEEDDESILKDIIVERRKHFCHLKKIKDKYNYSWEKEGKEIIQKINDKNINKEELKKILSVLLLNEYDIPQDILLEFWLKCSGAEEIMSKNKGQYKKLVKAFNILIKNKHPFYLFLEHKISVDLNRSFNYSKNKIKPENINQLRDILYAFSVRNTSINYCQGLNGIVAYLLQMTNFKEEESFYLFLNLMENILPYEYYLYAIGIEAELNVLNKILDKYEPDLIKFLNDNQCSILLFGILTKFITSLLIFKINEKITNFAFNCFFGFALLEEKGDAFYYFHKISLSIIRMLKPDLMKCKNYQEVNEILKLENKLKKEDIENMIYYTLFDESENKLDIDYVKQLRQEEIKKIMENKKANFKVKKEGDIKCNTNYPICIEELNNPSPIELNVNYKSLNDKGEGDDINKINEEENDDDVLKEIIVERRKHFCQK